IQASYGTTQWCSSEWEELCSQRSDGEESEPSALDSCIAALQKQEEQSAHTENLSHGLVDVIHKLITDTCKSLLDVVDEEVGLKDMLPVIGSLKHMRAWHSARMFMVTEHSAGWQKAALYLDGRLCSPSVHMCNKTKIFMRLKFVSELKFEGFCLRAQRKNRWSDALYPHTDPQCHTDQKLQHELNGMFLMTVYTVNCTFIFLFVLFHTLTFFYSGLASKSVNAKLLLDQLCTLRGEVGALISLSCVISTETFPAASQLSSCKWRDFMSKRPKDIPVPDVEVKGERDQLFLVQGAESASCTAQMIHTASQINGAAALAMLNALIREKVLPSSGSSTADWLQSLPCLRGEQFSQRERNLANEQTLVLKECCRKCFPGNRKSFTRTSKYSHAVLKSPQSNVKCCARTEWPERSILQNYENIQRARQRSRCRLFSSGSSESLMGPKDSQRGSSTLLDARELLKHFTPDGLPSGELQPLPVLRGEHAFQLSPDLTPRKVTKLPFSKAARSHYHGIEFCLDERKALERDRGFVKLQSHLIRYETQSTCCKEPCPVPFALSPAPSPAVLSEPGSVPDGEALHSEPPRLKCCSRETDLQFCKLESSESLGAGGTHPAVEALCHSRSSSGLASQTQTYIPESHGIREVVAQMLNKHGISTEHECFKACSQRLFDISKFYLKDLKTSRGLHEEMKKAASNNAKQVIDWVVEKSSKR
uniref:MDM2 binding protein n=1 Tax=Cyprinus carpio TaxID=7962 RepID=A0A8C2G6U8_CYPCA